MKAKRWQADEQGVALVEMAIVLPLLILMLFGIVEFGLAFNKRLTIGNASQSAARVGTAVANNEYADIATLEALEQGLISLPGNGQDTIKLVYIYKATSTGGVTGSCPGSYCNVYQYDYDAFGCNWDPCPDPDLGPVDWTGRWDPESRNAVVGNLDVMGVRVFFSHEWATNAVPVGDVSCTAPPSGCWADTAIMRLEPQQLGVG
ncbi:MAG: TadE/TadG family type IV pilus assembly protein [Acidimicrobiia bacterium]